MFTPLKKLLCLLAIGFCLALTLHQTALSSEEPNPDHLTLEGQAAMERQDYAHAIALFQQAEALYDEEGNEEGVIGTQVNQAIALDQAGRKSRACKQLSKAIHVTGVCDAFGLEEISVERSIDNEPGVIGLRALSNILIDIGYTEEATAVVERLSSLAPDTSTTLQRLLVNSAEIELILNRQKLSAEDVSTNVMAQIQHKVSEGDRLLTQLLDAPTNILLPAIIHTLKTEALIDEAGIAIEQSQKGDLYDAFLTAETFQSLHYQRFNALATTIDSLIQLGRDQQLIDTLLDRASLATVTQADEARLSFLKGQFLDSQGTNKQDVKQFYQRAADLATLAHKPILAYSSYHQLALLRHESPKQKIQLLKQAIAQLEEAKSTLAITPNLLPKLEYDIQTIFNDYMGELIQQGKPIGPIHSTMKRWRVDTYLRCSNYTASEANEAPSEEGIIHIAVLDEAIVTSIQKNGREQQYVTDKEPTLDVIHQLMHELEPRNATPDLTTLKTASKQAYDSLLQAAIEENFTVGDTLQFNVDPALETLPMATLFNGEHFLIEDFLITYNAGLSANKDHSGALTTLIGSMSVQNPEHPFSLRFPPLPEVELEARSIKAVLDRVYQINNEEFTLNNFKDTLGKQKPSIVHIATHGLFSANPRDTALVAWDQPIHPQTLGHILRNNPLKLLVFSSCDTAQGGRLGIAGLALQAGAKNTIASLSVVDSRATYILMSTFYRYLEAGNSIEESLSLAQRTLIQSSLFSHPAYWSQFILLNG